MLLLLIAAASWAGVASQSVQAEDGTTVTSQQGASQQRKCLPDAVEPALRRNLHGRTKSFPIGLWSVHGSQLELDTPSTLFEILAEEKLGYNVYSSDASTGFAQDALWALAGCETPKNQTDRGCHGGESSYHVAFGVSFSSAYMQKELELVQRLKMGGVLENLASMGYLVRSGLYAAERVLWSGFHAANRTFLDDYRSYDADHHQPQEHFSQLQDIDSSMLLPCEDWTRAREVGREVATYVLQTGDLEGVVGVLGAPYNFQVKCEGRWWKAPSCRANATGASNASCLPCLTGSVDGVGYNIGEVMQKASSWNMPLALGVTQGILELAQLVERHDVLFAFWEPDVTMIQLHPQLVSFPKHSAAQWQLGLLQTASEAQDPRIVVSSELMRLAPDVREMLLKMKWSVTDIDLMMAQGLVAVANQTTNFQNTSVEAEVKSMAESLAAGNWVSGAAWEGACRWLKDHWDIWEAWLPTTSSCLQGQGMFELGKGWIATHQDDAVCRPCPPGRFSEMLYDANLGDTAVCRPCTPGTSQSAYSSLVCPACPAGMFAQYPGATECTKCSLGAYQNLAGQSSCRDCGKNRNTSITGATGEAQCSCPADTYNMSAQVGCVPCPTGLSCAGGDASPQQEAGYWAEVVGPGQFSVFTCQDLLRCPAGEPESCADGRTGRACAECFKGKAGHPDGTCRACDAFTWWPFVVAPLLVCLSLPVLVAVGILLSRARRVAISLFVVCVVFGQLVVCLQSLEAISQFDILWVDPAKAVLQSLAIFSLDIEFSCVLPPRSHEVEYTSQLMAYPVILLATFLLWLLTRLTRKPVSFSAFLNLHGVLVVALLTAMSLTVLRPFQCRENPNGTTTMATRTDVICWTEANHQALITLACLGIVLYPVTILTGISFLTWKYPIWLRSGGGLEALERYKFLFGRFRPERYYYGLILSAHNLVVAMIPAVLVSVPFLQVGIMGVVVCFKLVVQSLLWPWRIDVANYNDMVLSTALLILLLLASPLLRLDQQGSTHAVAVLLSCVMCLLPLAAICAAAFSACLRLRPQSKYAMFLCHHKAGAGALCRFIKLIVHKYGKMNIFLDSDELDDLARIFDIVSCDSKALVAVLTPELLQRMWCAGEMTSARKNNIPIIPLYCDGFAFPDAESIDNIESVWTEEQRYTLTSYGISMEDIKAAYHYISSLDGFALSRSASLEHQEQLVLNVVTAVQGGGWGRMEVSKQGSVSNARILLMSTEQEPEAVSTVLILQQMVQLHLRISTIRVRGQKDITSAASASFALVLLSKGVLQDPMFAMLVCQLWAQALTFVPVNDGTFQFPPPDFYLQVEENAVPGLSANAGPSLAKAYQALLGILALPLTPHASKGILERQVAQICQRFGNLEDLLEQMTVSKSTNFTNSEVNMADVSMSLQSYEDVDPDSKNARDEDCISEETSELSIRDDLWYT